QHRKAWLFMLERFQQIQSGALGQRDVQQHQIEWAFAQPRQCLGYAARFGCDDAIAVRLQDALESLAHDDMIVDDENLELTRHRAASRRIPSAGTAFSGRRTVIRVPDCGALTTLTSPPSCAARSPSPNKPKEPGLLRASGANPQPSSTTVISI